MSTIDVGHQPLPKTLSGFNYFFDADDWQGLIEEGKLPDLEAVSETFSPSTGLGEVEVGTGRFKVSPIEMTIREPRSTLIAAIGQRKVGVFKGSLRVDDNTEHSYAIKVHGLVQKVSLGTAKPGDSKVQLTQTIDLITIEINDKEVLFINLVNGRMRRDGVETKQAQQRLANMGIS